MDKGFNGRIYLLSILNIDTDAMGLKSFDETNFGFVFYPNCQQIQIWLPDYHAVYDRITIVDSSTQALIYNQKVSDVVSGSIKVVIDSLFIPNGSYMLQIFANQVMVHAIRFQKMNEGEFPPNPEEDISKNKDQENTPIVYRDGFGNDIKYDNDSWREIYW